MKRVKFLTKGLRAIHGQPRESQFFHLVDEEKDLDDETARVAVGAGAAEYVDEREPADDEAGDDEEAQAGGELEKTGLLQSWFGGGSDAPSPAAPELEPEPAPTAPEPEPEQGDDAEAGAETPPALE